MTAFKRIATILILGFFCRTFIACCACYSTDLFYAYKKEFHVDNLDNTGPTGKISTAESIPKEAFGLRLKFDVETIACKPTLNDVFSAAVAGCSCNGYSWAPQHRISAITVTTLAAFDAEHPAGSNVSDLFKVLQGDTYKNIPQYLKYELSPSATEPKGFVIELYLLTPPTNPGPHSFNTAVSFQADSVYSQISRPVILQ